MTNEERDIFELKRRVQNLEDIRGEKVDLLREVLFILKGTETDPSNNKGLLGRIAKIEKTIEERKEWEQSWNEAKAKLIGIGIGLTVGGAGLGALITKIFFSH